MNPATSLRSTLTLLAILLSSPLCAQEIPARVLLDVAAKNAAANLTPTSTQVTVFSSTEPEKPGLVVTMQPGDEAYPGVKLKPQGEDAWNLSNYGHVETRITNTGTKPLRLNLRIDNPGPSSDKPWNAESLNIEPNRTATLRVIFGYSYGFSPSFALNPDKVTTLLLFTGKVEEAQSFRVESVLAAGPPGEKPTTNTASMRIKPKDGIILGPAAKIEPKQIETAGGVQATLDGQALAVTFPDSSTKQFAKLKPALGRWHLGDATQVQVRLKNTGSVPVTPTLELTSDQQSGQIKVTAPAIAPNATADVVLPFAPAAPWQGVSAAERKGTHDSKPGTGTTFASDKTDSLILTAQHKGPASLRVESIVATCTVATIPDWLGQRPPVAGDWVKTFEDNFDGTTINETKWNLPNPYGDNWYAWAGKETRLSKDQVLVGDGKARLRYEKKPGYKNDDPKLAHYEYSCGYLDTFDKFDQCYGYFEARMKLPTAPGLWPAFWMMPNRGPNSGDQPNSRRLRCSTSNSGMEFDIMEHLTIWGSNRYNLAMHWDDYGPNHKATGTGKIYVQPDKDGYITSGLLWLPGQTIYYCNGVEVGRWEDPRVGKVPGYLMFTLPMGGWDGNVLNGSGLPDDFVVDYVRVWQRKDLMLPGDKTK